MIHSGTGRPVIDHCRHRTFHQVAEGPEDLLVLKISAA